MLDNRCNKSQVRVVDLRDSIPNSRKVVQVPVEKGWGEKQELVVADLTIAPPSPPVFRVEDTFKDVVITQYKLIPIMDYEEGRMNSCKAKVIINGYIDKNINYKTITDFTTTDVNGPLYQFTTRIDFHTFVEVKSSEPIFATDNVNILKAVVEGEKDENIDPNPVAVGAPDWAVTYNGIIEKMIVYIKLSITRNEKIQIYTDC